MFSERLKLARKRSGLSLRALSSAMGGIVSAPGDRQVRAGGDDAEASTVASALAEALEVSLSYLMSPSKVSLESVEFRKLASTRARERAAVEGEVLDHVDRLPAGGGDPGDRHHGAGRAGRGALSNRLRG